MHKEEGRGEAVTEIDIVHLQSNIQIANVQFSGSDMNDGIITLAGWWPFVRRY